MVLRLNVDFPAALTSFFRIRHESSVDLLSHIFAALTEKADWQQFVQPGFEVCLGVLSLSVAVVDERSHEGTLCEREDPVNTHEFQSLRQIEFQTQVMRHVEPLVPDVRNQFLARYVSHADVVVHLFQRQTDHVCVYRQMFRTQQICRVVVVQMFGIIEIDFQYVSDGGVVDRVHVERIDLRLTQKSEIAQRKVVRVTGGVERICVEITEIR